MFFLYGWGVPYMKTLVQQFQSSVIWIQTSPIFGFITLIGCFMMISMFGFLVLLPGTPPTIGAGYMFGCALGFWKGLVLATLGVWIGDSLGALVVFLVTRHYFKSSLMKWFVPKEKKNDEPQPKTSINDARNGEQKKSVVPSDSTVHPRHRTGSQRALAPVKEQRGMIGNAFLILKALDRSLTEKGVVLACLLRLSPFFPFSSINYLLAISSLPAHDFLLATPSLLPGVFANVMIGTTFSAGTDICLMGSPLAGVDGDLNAFDVHFKGTSGNHHAHLSNVKIVFAGMGILASIGALAIITHQAKASVEKMIREQEQEVALNENP